MPTVKNSQALAELARPQSKKPAPTPAPAAPPPAPPAPAPGPSQEMVAIHRSMAVMAAGVGQLATAIEKNRPAQVAPPTGMTATIIRDESNRMVRVDITFQRQE